MSEIADFLRARYVERRAAISPMPNGPWTWHEVESLEDTGKYEALAGDDAVVLSAADEEGYHAWIDKHDGLDDFLAVVQPQELLADLDAKLALVDRMIEMLAAAEGDTEVDHYGALDAAETTFRILAQPFAGHPDHKGEEWAP